jgi:hypothetical protein
LNLYQTDRTSCAQPESFLTLTPPL